MGRLARGLAFSAQKKWRAAGGDAPPSRLSGRLQADQPARPDTLARNRVGKVNAAVFPALKRAAAMRTRQDLILPLPAFGQRHGKLTVMAAFDTCSMSPRNSSQTGVATGGHAGARPAEFARCHRTQPNQRRVNEVSPDGHPTKHTIVCRPPPSRLRLGATKPQMLRSSPYSPP